MAEIRRSQAQSGVSELEKIFQEYKSKLEHAEQEANEIIDVAWQKAEIIIVDKQKEAQGIADDIRQQADKEAERIIDEARRKADEIERDTADRTRREAKERTKKETEKILAETRQEAEQESSQVVAKAKREAEDILGNARESARAQVYEESEVILAEAREKAKQMDEDAMERMVEAGKLITDIAGRADDIVNRFKTQVQVELAELAHKLDKARDDLEIKSVLLRSEAGDTAKAPSGGQFQGRRELNVVQPYDRGQIRKLTEALKQIPGVKMDGESGTEESFTIYLKITEPVPLDEILQEMSLVENIDIRGNAITLQLREGEREFHRSF